MAHKFGFRERITKKTLEGKGLTRSFCTLVHIYARGKLSQHGRRIAMSRLHGLLTAFMTEALEEMQHLQAKSDERRRRARERKDERWRAQEAEREERGGSQKPVERNVDARAGPAPDGQASPLRNAHRQPAANAEPAELQPEPQSMQRWQPRRAHKSGLPTMKRIEA